MNKIYLTLLALFATLGANAAHVVLNITSTYSYVWVWDSGEGWNATTYSHSDNLKSYYSEKDFYNLEWKTGESSWSGQKQENNSTDLRCYEGNTYKGIAKLKGSFDSDAYTTKSLTCVSGTVYQTEEMTMRNGTVKFGFVADNNGTQNWWKGPSGATLSANGDEALCNWEDGGDATINLTAGTKYCLQLDFSTMKVKLVVTSTPTPVVTTQDLYLHVEGVKDTSGWASHFYLGNAMETEYSKSFEISGETFNFVFSNSSSLSWTKADGFYAPSGSNNKLVGLDTETSQGQNDGTKCLYAGNGAGTYTVKAKYNADHTSVIFTVTKSENGGGGDDPVNTEDPEGYVSTELGIEFETPVDLTLASYYIPTPDLVPNRQGYRKQLEVAHSHAGQGKLEYTWVKYHDPSEGYSANWMYYESDDNIPEADTERIGIIQSHPWHKNKTASEISGRAHAVNNNSGASHDCRNFSDAYYRVYGEMDEHPDKAKAISRARQIGHITPGNLSKKARVAYTLAVGDNTSGIDEVAADAAASDAAPVYYNLQGVVVANPQAGQVYIVRRGETVTKELYR